MNELIIENLLKTDNKEEDHSEAYSFWIYAFGGIGDIFGRNMGLLRPVKINF